MATTTKLCRCSPGLQKFVQTVEQGKTTIKLGPIFGLDDIVEAVATRNPVRRVGSYTWLR
jgi:hypothetical protein